MNTFLVITLYLETDFNNHFLMRSRREEKIFSGKS